MTGAAKIFCRKYIEGRNKQLKKIKIFAVTSTWTP